MTARLTALSAHSRGLSQIALVVTPDASFATMVEAVLTARAWRTVSLGSPRDALVFVMLARPAVLVVDELVSDTLVVGVDLLESARALVPATRRILLSSRIPLMPEALLDALPTDETWPGHTRAQPRSA